MNSVVLLDLINVIFMKEYYKPLLSVPNSVVASQCMSA